MKLTIIGCHGPFTTKDGACSSYLISDGATNIVADLGSGALARLMDIMPVERISALVLTHLHFDHIADVFLLKYAIGQMKMRGYKIPVIPLYLPASPFDISDELIAGSEGIFEPHIIKDGAEFTTGSVKTVASVMKHPVESYGLSFFADGRKISYTGDTVCTDNVYKLAYDADLYIADGGLLEKHGGPGAPHMTVATAAQSGKDAKRTVITHISPVYETVDILAELPEGAELASEGCIFEI